MFREKIFTSFLLFALVSFPFSATFALDTKDVSFTPVKDQKVVVDVILQDELSRLNFDALNSAINNSRITIQNHAVSVGGYMLEYNRGETFSQTQRYSDEQIRNSLITNFTLRTRITDLENYNGMILLDLEHPVHPRDLHQYISNAELFSDIIYEFKRRIAIARDVFPNAKLSIYGAPVPAVGPNAWSERMIGLIYAGFEGLYDDLDYISPVLYTKFGPDDNFDHIRASKILTKHSVQLANIINLIFRGPDKLGVYPLFSYPVKNQSSFNDGQTTDKAYYYAAFKILAENDIHRYAFWSDKDLAPTPHLPRPIQGFMINLFRDLSAQNTAPQNAVPTQRTSRGNIR